MASDFKGYRWEAKKVTKPGETEPVVQMHLIPPDDEVARQRADHVKLMSELRSNGFIKLPPELASAVGFSNWDPKNQGQTYKVLAEMSKKDDK